MNVVMTRHATERALDMQVTGEQIRACLTAPMQTFYNALGLTLQRGRIALGCTQDGDVIVVKTVLWVHASRWRDDLARGAYNGRVAR